MDAASDGFYFTHLCVAFAHFHICRMHHVYFLQQKQKNHHELLYMYCLLVKTLEQHKALRQQEKTWFEKTNITTTLLLWMLKS